MRIIITVAIVLICSCSRLIGQEWTSEALDSTITVQFPSHSLKETVGSTTTWTVMLEGGAFMIVVRIDTVAMNDEVVARGGLSKYYSDFVKGALGGLEQAKLLSDTLVDYHGHLVKKWTSRSVVEGTMYTQRYMCIYINNASYALSVWSTEDTDHEIASTTEHFFSSLVVRPGITQPVSKGTAYELGRKLGEWTFYAILVVGLVVVIVVIRRRRQK